MPKHCYIILVQVESKHCPLYDPIWDPMLTLFNKGAYGPTENKEISINPVGDDILIHEHARLTMLVGKHGCGWTLLLL